MTVKIEHVTIAEEFDYSWIPDATVSTRPSDQDLLAMVRHIMRERNDCTKIPVVLGASLITEPNQYGHNLFIHVEYSARRNWQATYAGLLTDSGVSNVQCYMD